MLPQEDCLLARRAYDLLRRLESRIRIVHDRASDELPATQAGLTKLARRMGYGGGDARSPGEALLADYLDMRARVRELFERLVAPVQVS